MGMFSSTPSPPPIPVAPPAASPPTLANADVQNTANQARKRAAAAAGQSATGDPKALADMDTSGRANNTLLGGSK